MPAQSEASHHRSSHSTCEYTEIGQLATRLAQTTSSMGFVSLQVLCRPNPDSHTVSDPMHLCMLCTVLAVHLALRGDAAHNGCPQPVAVQPVLLASAALIARAIRQLPLAILHLPPCRVFMIDDFQASVQGFQKPKIKMPWVPCASWDLSSSIGGKIAPEAESSMYWLFVSQRSRCPNSCTHYQTGVVGECAPAVDTAVISSALRDGGAAAEVSSTTLCSGGNVADRDLTKSCSACKCQTLYH